MANGAMSYVIKQLVCYGASRLRAVTRVVIPCSMILLRGADAGPTLCHALSVQPTVRVLHFHCHQCSSSMYLHLIIIDQ